jgi:hypothetical protein
MKLCKDCIHFKGHSWKPEELSKCAYEQEPVTGKPKDFCDLSRKYGPCGVSARFFNKGKDSPVSKRWFEFWR